MTAVATGRSVRELLEDESLELTFVQHRRSGTVHVVTPVDPDLVPERVDNPDPLAVVLAFCRTPARTICGYQSYVWMDPSIESDNFVDTFHDDAICSSCIRVLGDLSNRAFEHPIPRDSNESDEEEE